VFAYPRQLYVSPGLSLWCFGAVKPFDAPRRKRPKFFSFSFFSHSFGLLCVAASASKGGSVSFACPLHMFWGFTTTTHRRIGWENEKW
jgi:hypothetical protein